ncbi:MAG: LamG-like jellyroll fold domain-containing protein [Pseudomonadota bacterium]
MAYRDDIIALGANHLYPCVGNLNDIIGTLNFANTGGAFSGPQICEDAASSYVTNGTNDNGLAATDVSVQDVTQDYCYALWFQTTAIQQPPCRVFGDGGQTASNSFLLGFGNSIVCEADCDPDVIQVGSSVAIEPDRPYHLALVFRDAGGGSSELEFFLDGVSQGTTSVADVMSSGRGGFRIGGATNTTTVSIGGSAFQLVSPVNGYYAMISTLVSANVPTNAQIRLELFEKGTLAGVTINAGAEASMQIALDALASTARPDEPLNIRIEEVIGGGTLNLTANAITHSALASAHIQYMGSGVLNYTNTNGSNASIGSAPNGGTINFINPAILTVSPLVAGSEVRFYEAGTSNELAGVEASGATFASSVSANSVDIVVHKEDYLNIRIRAVDMTGGDVSVPIQQVFDRQYENA